jgi:NADPH-dependent 2,4-dienoyl-CoA reductase/sulfur reductase-like enzyme
MAKIVLIGANHACTAAANTLLDNYTGNELTIIDSNDKISYLGCGTALWVGRQIDGSDSLFYAAIMYIGFKPNTALGRDKLEVFTNGAYKVDLTQKTSNPDVYAIGDCATILSNAVEDTAYIALATNAVRSGIVAGHNVGGTKLESIGVQGSNGISIYGYNMVSTGLSVKAAKKAGYDVLYTDYEDLQKPGFMKDNEKVKIRIVYDSKTRRLLGAQLASRADISMGIHLFSLAIEEKVTIDRLKLLDIFFLPHFNQPYNYITMAALSAK